MKLPSDLHKRLLLEFQNRLEMELNRLLVMQINTRASLQRTKKIREKHPSDGPDSLARHMIRQAQKETTLTGAGTGLTSTISGGLIALPDPTMITKVIGGAGLLTSSVTDAVATIIKQMHLVTDLATVYDVPYNSDDQEEVWSILFMALGSTGTGAVQTSDSSLVDQAKWAVKPMVGQGWKKALRDWLATVGVHLVARRTASNMVSNMLPVINIAVGAGGNAALTRQIGLHGRTRARYRRAIYNQILDLKDHQHFSLMFLPELLTWAAAPYGVMTVNGAGLLTFCTELLPERPLIESGITLPASIKTLETHVTDNYKQIPEDVRKRVYQLTQIVCAGAMHHYDHRTTRFLTKLAEWLKQPYHEKEFLSLVGRFTN